MAYCHNHKKMKKNFQTVNASDDNLLDSLDRHKEKDFWDQFKDSPDRHAYVRRWGCVLRRAARWRGLI